MALMRKKSTVWWHWCKKATRKCEGTAYIISTQKGYSVMALVHERVMTLMGWEHSVMALILECDGTHAYVMWKIQMYIVVIECNYYNVIAMLVMW